VKSFKVSDFATAFVPHATSYFINDLEGTCYGIESLGKEGNLTEYYELLWEPSGSLEPALRGSSIHPGNNVVLAAGTGLGTGLLMPRGRGLVGHSVLPLEGGHTTATVTTLNSEEAKEERELVTYLSLDLYKREHQIEYEDIVSGRGVIKVFNYFARKLNASTATDIDQVTSALKEEGARSTAAFKTFKYFFSFLLRIAQNLTVTTQAKCVFLAGDNQVANLEVVRNLREFLKKGFHHHSKPQWVEPVLVWTQTKRYNFNLKGALYVAGL
jgi:glucokinase